MFVCILHVTRHSSLTQLHVAQKFNAKHSRRRMVIASAAEFSGEQSHEIGPLCVYTPAEGIAVILKSRFNKLPFAFLKVLHVFTFLH